MTIEVSLEAAAASLEAKQQRLAGLLDPLDYPGDWTQRQRDSYEHDRSVLQAGIQTLRENMEVLARAEPQLVDLRKWSADLTRIRPILCDELIAIGRPSTPREHGLYNNVKISIRTIDFGMRIVEDTGYSISTLRLGHHLRNAGYPELPPVENQMAPTMVFHGSLEVTNDHIYELEKQCKDARYRLAAALREPVAAATVAS